MHKFPCFKLIRSGGDDGSGGILGSDPASPARQQRGGGDVFSPSTARPNSSDDQSAAEQSAAQKIPSPPRAVDSAANDPTSPSAAPLSRSPAALASQRETSSTVGMLWGIRARASRETGSAGPPVYGAAHANRSLIDAALACLQQSVSLYARPSSLDSARQHVESLARRFAVTDGRRNVAAVSSLVEDWSARRLNLWFNPTGDISSFLDFRAATGCGEIPVVSVHHTISYRIYLQARFLMLLLAKPRPFDAIVCTSRAAKQAVENALCHTAESLSRAFGMNVAFNGKLPILPLTVDTETFAPREKEACRTALGLNHRDFILLFLGRGSAVDKADLLPWMQALCRLPVSTQERLVLVLAGRQEPEAAAELKAFAEQRRAAFRIDLRGVVAEQTKPALYSAADVFISAADSVQEMFGLAPLEAMACGTPQIVSDWDGYRDTVVDGETGFLIPAIWAPCTADLDLLSLVESADWHDTHFSLAQSVAIDCDLFLARLKQMIADTELRERMSRASRERAVDLFSWPVVMRRYSELFDSVVEEAQRYVESPQGDANPFLLHPRYFDLFRRFASQIVTAETRLRASSFARFENSGWAARLPYPGFQELDPGVLSLAAGTAASGGEWVTAEQVIEVCRRTHPALTESAAWRHLMWLVKYGFVTVR